MAGTVDVLRRQWESSSHRLRERLVGLTDDEFRWEPVPGCWNVRRVGDSWTMDYPDVAPDPPPVTTIAWRLLHITHGTWMYADHAFGSGTMSFLDLEIHGTAAAAVEDLVASQQRLADVLDRLDDAGLERDVATHLGDEPWTAAAVITTLIDEQIHHGAEIGLLRDLYLRLGPADD
jgi:hypothetical protein